MNPALPHCRRILFHPSHEGSPKIRLGFCHNNVRKNKQCGDRVGLGTGTEALSSQAGGTGWAGPLRGTRGCNEGRKLRACRTSTPRSRGGLRCGCRKRGPAPHFASVPRPGPSEKGRARPSDRSSRRTPPHRHHHHHQTCASVCKHLVTILEKKRIRKQTEGRRGFRKDAEAVKKRGSLLQTLKEREERKHPGACASSVTWASH